MKGAYLDIEYLNKVEGYLRKTAKQAILETLSRPEFKVERLGMFAGNRFPEEKWVVFKGAGRSRKALNDLYWHESEESAKKEALRCAKQHPGEEFRWVKLGGRVVCHKETTCTVEVTDNE